MILIKGGALHPLLFDTLGRVGFGYYGVRPSLCTVCSLLPASGSSATDYAVAAWILLPCNSRLPLRASTSQKSVICKECEAGFILGKDLKIHLQTHRDTRFYSLFVQGRFFGNTKQTNAVFFSNILGLVIGYHKTQFYLVWLSEC